MFVAWEILLNSSLLTENNKGRSSKVEPCERGYKVII